MFSFAFRSFRHSVARYLIRRESVSTREKEKKKRKKEETISSRKNANNFYIGT